jgi:hypothetical protein
MGQFLDHPQTVDLVFRGVMQNMQPDEAREEVVVFHGSSSARSLSHFDNERR